MAQRSRMPNRRSRNSKAHRRRRVIGPVAAAGAFLATAMTPLATAPPAHADEFDSIIDPIINSIAGSITGLFDSLAGSDVGSLGLPAADLAARSGVGAGAADSALAASAASSFDTMLQALAQEWINSQSGERTTLSSIRCGTTSVAAES